VPRESYNVRVLRGKALSSLRTAVTAFNGLDSDGRTTIVLLSLQHSFEMLVKAMLEAKKDKRVFDKQSQKAIPLDAAIRRCQSKPGIQLSDEEAGTIRVIDALRNAEQHWHLVVDEGLMYLNARAAITLFDDLLYRVFQDRLGNHIPARVLPISAEPPQGLDLLVDREFERIANLLHPGRRATGEAQGRIRALLATEALADPDAASISEADVGRVTKGIRDGKSRVQVFPKLSGVASTTIPGDGITVEVRFTKQQGLPVTYTSDPTADASAIRTVDLEKKFYMGTYELADRAGVRRSLAVALRRHLGIDDDQDFYSHEFVFGSSKHRRYSDNALSAMKASLPKIDLNAVWDAHRTYAYNQEKNPPPCRQPGCVDASTSDA